MENGMLCVKHDKDLVEEKNSGGFVEGLHARSLIKKKVESFKNQSTFFDC
jgi:hypothetical protein